MKIRDITAVSILCAVLLAIGFLFTPLMKQVRSTSWDIAIQLVARIFNIQDIVVSQSTTDKINTLTAENVRLTSELVDYKRLREQLGAPAFASFTAIPAHVIARPIDTLKSQYVINKGIANGVSIGDSVVVQGSVLIGFITELSQHTAIVQTLFASKTSVTAETTSEDTEAAPARGLITSQYQLSLIMKTIPRDSVVTIGQHVVTTSNGNQIPHGMMIGTIETVTRPGNEAYQQADITVPYNPDAIEAVTILSAP